HQSSPGIWLRLMKKASGQPGVSYAEALEIALSFGWIDGQTKTYDAHSWLRKFVPRGARSIWSKINREKALALIAEKRMHPAGLAQVERAKKDGRWAAAYDSAQKAKPSPDFAAALAASPRAAAFFATLTGANRYSVLFRVQAPKKPETRARKIQELIEMLEQGKKIHG
ncbi:MAG TPA: YdeI/OmpD-associated family protein, partial [Polyangiaceae bacterium]